MANQIATSQLVTLSIVFYKNIVNSTYSFYLLNIHKVQFSIISIAKQCIFYAVFQKSSGRLNTPEL